jgi:UTP--glucose-1-phosphate uridylyltransferase
MTISATEAMAMVLGDNARWRVPSADVSDRALDRAVEKLREDGAGDSVVAAFERRFAQLDDPDAGFIHGDDLEPLEDVPALEDLPDADKDGPAIAVVKLNGGLGTSMGLHGPKSLIEVKPGVTFLDVIARQAEGRPLVLMNSFSTDEATRGVGVDARMFLQSREPKLREEDRQPVEWPQDPSLEWCPPGHGDVYVSLAGSGMLDALLGEGIAYAFISNSDNLGATPDARIAAWAAANDVPFAMEVVRGTAADRKGGHIARRRSDGRIVLRETAQTPPGDDSFTDVERWRYYNTNNLWIDLKALKQMLEEDPAGPELPLIVNHKTVDPRDKASTPVLQLETAMGAAIGAIEGARAVLVPRTRFAPVKTTDDLLVVRSDAYELDNGTMRPTFDGPPPVVSLDPEFYKSLPDMEQRFPHGPPSLREARSFTVTGDITFGDGVVVRGDGEVTA